MDGRILMVGQMRKSCWCLIRPAKLPIKDATSIGLTPMPAFGETRNCNGI
jgi:hypothetical protein